MSWNTGVSTGGASRTEGGCMPKLLLLGEIIAVIAGRVACESVGFALEWNIVVGCNMSEILPVLRQQRAKIIKITPACCCTSSYCASELLSAHVIFMCSTGRIERTRAVQSNVLQRRKCLSSPPTRSHRLNLICSWREGSGCSLAIIIQRKVVK